MQEFNIGREYVRLRKRFKRYIKINREIFYVLYKWL